MKRMFTVISLLAIVHLVALASLAGYAWGQGWLERERVEKAVAVLVQDEVAEGEEDSGGQASEVTPAEASTLRIRRNEEADEIARTELDRREREIRDGWKMLETAGVVQLRDKEAFEEERKGFQEALRRREAEADSSGLKAELKILEGIKPKDAKELLRQKKDADVVRMLLSMDVRKSRKIVSACKTDEERLWIGRILERLHESQATQAEVLGAGAPSP